MEFELWQIIVIFFVTFFAESYGAVVGGGSFIIQPTLIFFGVPAQLAAATDVAANSGTAAGALLVLRKRSLIRWDLLKNIIPALILGTFIGVELLSIVSDKVLEYFISIMALLMLIYTLVIRKKFGLIEKPLPSFYKLKSFFFGFTMGAYTSFSGVGAGTVSSIILSSIFGTTLLQSIATRKIVHVIPMVLGFFGFIYHGLIVWQLFFPMFVACFLGGVCGGKISLVIGDKYLRPVFITAVVIFSLYLLLK